MLPVGKDKWKKICQERKKKKMACSTGSEGDNERETIGGVKLCGWDNY